MFFPQRGGTFRIYGFLPDLNDSAVPWQLAIYPSNLSAAAAPNRSTSPIGYSAECTLHLVEFKIVFPKW